MLFIEIFTILLLTLVNGILSMSELAVVSSRTARLKVLAAKGNQGAAVAMRLAADPGRFISSAQIGITLVGVLSGAFSGATLGARLAAWLNALGLSPAVANAFGVGSVVLVITYLSLIIGELVPKQIALRDPETVASRVAPAMNVIATLTSPLVWLLDRSGRIVLALLGQTGKVAGSFSDEEIKSILAEAYTAGIIESEESEMIAGVMRLADRRAKALMTPRLDVEVVNLHDSLEDIREQLRSTRRSRLPVKSGQSDDVDGVLLVKDFYDALSRDESVDMRSLVRHLPTISDLSGAVEVMTALRQSSTHMVLVYDEHGHFEGVITSGDILEAITGTFANGQDESASVERHDGSFLIAGWMPIDEFAHQFDYPFDRDADYQTVAGLVLDEFQQLPQLGESFEKHGLRFEIVDLDRRRIDTILISRI